ncbi:OmpL47-type beta-barrel domain-containing protein, partial [Kibdelosporangium aridum]
DNANNVSPEGTVNFTVVASPDTTPPTVTSAVAGDKDPQGNYINKATVTITATDAQSGVKSTEYKLDSGNWTPYTAPVEVTAAGAHMIHYRATDNANNVSAEGMASFTIVAAPDTTAPTTNATVAGPKDPNGNYIDSAAVTITATDAQSGVKLIEYSLDNGAWQQYMNTFPVSAKGAHTVKYRASDNAGNVAPEKSVSFTVVEPGSDACPDSDTRETVIIERDDTGVANVDTGNGCTVSDLVDQYRDWPSHGDFVRHVDTVTTELVTRGVLSRRDAGTLVRAASRSDIGR